MRILLHECLPRELLGELVGQEVATVQQLDWHGLKNGELLKKAAGQFEVFLTIDQLLIRQQTIPPNLGVVTIRARSNRIQDLLPLIPELLRTLNEAKPGKAVSIGRPKRK